MHETVDANGVRLTVRRFDMRRRQIIQLEAAKDELRDLRTQGPRNDPYPAFLAQAVMAGIARLRDGLARLETAGTTPEGIRGFITQTHALDSPMVPRTIREAFRQLYDSASTVRDTHETVMNAVQDYAEAFREMWIEEEYLAPYVLKPTLE